MIDAWRCNECLIETPQGLYVWTSSYHPDKHQFFPLKDSHLWEWFDVS